MIEKGGLVSYNFGKMFNPESLIISIKQVFCRKGLVDFDDIKLTTNIIENNTEIIDVHEGLVISGLYLH